MAFIELTLVNVGLWSSTKYCLFIYNEIRHTQKVKRIGNTIGNYWSIRCHAEESFFLVEEKGVVSRPLDPLANFSNSSLVRTLDLKLNFDDLSTVNVAF